MDESSRPPAQRLSVQRAIAAEPPAIFDVLRTPGGHVAIDASGMLMSADGDPVTGVGDRFTVHMDRESLNDYPLGEYTVNVVISRFEPDRAIAWTIDGVMQPPIGHVYGYELEPVDGGTLVTSYYDWSDIHENYRAAADSIFPVISETNLRATLGILAGWPRPASLAPAPRRRPRAAPTSPSPRPEALSRGGRHAVDGRSPGRVSSVAPC